MWHQPDIFECITGLLLLFILFLSHWYLSTLSLYRREKVLFLPAVFFKQWLRSTDTCACSFLSCAHISAGRQQQGEHRWGWQPSGRQKVQGARSGKAKKGSGPLGELQSVFSPFETPQANSLAFFPSPLFVFCVGQIHPFQLRRGEVTCFGPVL